MPEAEVTEEGEDLSEDTVIVEEEGEVEVPDDVVVEDDPVEEVEVDDSLLVEEEAAAEEQVEEAAQEEEVEAETEVVTPAVRTFDVTAEQWTFTPSTIKVNEGDTVVINVTSNDVDHGFKITEFGVDAYLKPGITTTVQFVADQKGTFSFFCSVSCGLGHANMSGTLIVE